MKHIFKIPYEKSDIFICEIDLDEGEMIYDVREKETGKLLQSRTTKFEFSHDNVYFDGLYLTQDLFKIVYTTLTSDTPVLE
jgi:hypothetical protein